MKYIIASESFGYGTRFYFVDLCMAVNDTPFLRVTQSERKGEQEGKPVYERETVRVFEEELFMLIESIQNVFAEYAASAHLKLPDSFHKRSPARSARKRDRPSLPRDSVQ